MNAFEVPCGQFTLNTTADVEIRRFVKVNAQGGCEHATTAEDPIMGVSYTEAKNGRPLSIASAGLVMVEAAGTVAAGDMVVPTTDGKAIKATAPTDTNARTAGFFAVTGGSAGDLITIKL